MAHKHSIYDTDPHFSIDPVTRLIKNESGKVVVMQHDHNSERFTFEIQNIIDGHDMSLCNVVEIHYNNIESSTKDKYADVYEVSDLQKSPYGDDVTIFSWLVSGNATQHRGNLEFSITFKCIADDGTVDYEWGTAIYRDITIGERIRNSNQVVERDSDVLAKWKNDLFSVSDAEEANIITVSKKQQEDISDVGSEQTAAIEAKGAMVLDSIPEDYTTVSAMAKEAILTKADGIVVSATGESVVVSDSSDDQIRGLKVFGKSTQFTTAGRQLIPFPYSNMNETIDGVTFTVNDNGSVTASGTSTAGINFYFAKNYTLKAGTYTLSYSGNFSGARLNMYDFTLLESIAVVQDGTTSVTFTTTKDYSNVGIYLNTASVGKAFSGTIYPILETGTVANPFEPYTGGKAAPNPEYPQWVESIENATVDFYGKNLLNVPEQYTFNNVVGLDVYLPAGNYVLSYESETHGGENLPEFRFYDNKIWKTIGGAKSQIVMIHKPETKIYIYSNGTSSNGSNGVSATINKLMLSKIEGDYETPKAVQSITIDRTLPGIAVTSKGNYTDSNGQQWICDEIDFERRVYIQRVSIRILTGTEYCVLNAKAQEDGINVYQYYTESIKPIDNVFYCSHFTNAGQWDNGLRTGSNISWHTRSVLMFKFDGVRTLEDFKAFVAEQYAAGTPVTVWFAMETPVEIPLSETEIAAFKALKTSKPITTVMNDSSAHMELSYVADTKTYIDNKISELVKALTNNT